MRLLVQRVSQASVTVDAQVVGSIDKGLLVFLGIHKDDKIEKTRYLAHKLCTLRIFNDEGGKMNLSVEESDGGVLIISQFTLYANCSSGRRPDFFAAAPLEIARPFYEKFVSEVKEKIPSVQTGRFGALMQVHLINDGPVTLLIDSG